MTIATPAPAFGRNLGLSHFDDFMRTVMPELGIRLLPNTNISQISQGRAHLHNAISGETIEEFFDFIVAAIPPKPQDSLREICEQHARTQIVGDAIAPRDAMRAFREGDRAGRTV